MRRDAPSPAALFKAAADPAREEELAALGLTVVARPGMAAPTEDSPNLVAIWRGLGEHHLAVVSAVERVAPSRAILEAEGIPCEGYRDGVFVEVDHGVHGRRGLRIAGPDCMTESHVVLLRETGEDERTSEDERTPLATLLAATYALRRTRQRTVREEYLRSQLEPDSGTPPLRDDLQRGVADVEAGRPADAAAAALLAAAERAFILDPQRSTLELLEPAERDRYLTFAWHDNDFPGGPSGPNEGRADQMFDALTLLRPERRANAGTTAVVRRDEFDAAMQRRVARALVRVPGEGRNQLHRDASAAFVDLRTAAAAEGVTISINNSYRTPERAAQNAAAAGNAAAVASFSSHMLGLAVDLNMSHSGLRFTETGTRPFRNVVGMYKSPVHKWMFLRGDTYSWFPYKREPWHWEYNPTGFRERFRAAPSETTPATPREDVPSEAITEPIPPPRPPLALTGSVGRGGRNAAADVRGVQDRLAELRVLDVADATAERPTSAAPIAEAALGRTIDAIESFQRQLAGDVNGLVAPRSTTLTELDRVIALPTPADLQAITGELASIGQTIRRGLTISGAVGATATGNAVADVQAVQRRLVDVGRLSASHRESPAAGATGTIAQARLAATIAALRRFQQAEVEHYRSKGTISGAVTSGVVNPGDATAALLDRISAYEMTLGGTSISFHDHVPSGVTQSDAGVAFRGNAAPSALPMTAFTDLGLTAGQAAALKLVSTFEGNFDAINTYDRAIVSAGFIQFAGGGRGLGPYLALLKARQPAKFRDLLQKFGIDVEFGVASGAITGSRLVVLDPAGPRVLRARAAETAIRDDKKLTTAVILSGRDRDVQIAQIEAAARGYVLPALDAVVTWSSGRARAKLRDLLRSQKGMAALFDRAIQEGLGGAHRRFERVIQRLVRSGEPRPMPTPPPPPPSLAAMQSREGDVLAELERDLQAAADVRANLGRARTALDALIGAAAAAGATVPALLVRSELADARRAVTQARVGLADVVNVSASGDVDAQIAAMHTALTAEETRLALAPAPATVAALTTALTASRRAINDLAARVETAPKFLARIQRVRRSTLDAGLSEAA